MFWEKNPYHQGIIDDNISFNFTDTIKAECLVEKPLGKIIREKSVDRISAEHSDNEEEEF